MEELKKMFLELGYSEKEYVKIVNTYPIINMKPETLKKRVKENYDFLISLGYSKKEIIKMTKRVSAIYGYSIENIKQKIEGIEELGYNREEVIKMTKSFPSIYGLSIENIKQKIEDIEALGYSREEVIKMTKNLPSIYGFSIENIKQKIEFYDSIGLHSLAIVAPKNLMQSTKLSYARYMFFKEKGIVIDETNYNKLFVNQKQFEKQYGLTKNEILQKYPYEEWQASANEAKREKAKEDSKVQSDGERKEEVIQRIKGKQERISEQEEEISKLEIELQSKKNALE